MLSMPLPIRIQFAASLSSRRSLAVTRPAEDPTFFPNGGTFHDPIAVSLVSDDGAVVFYTIDGTTPDESSRFVTSSELLVLEETTTIRAIAAHGRNYFGTHSSAEVQANFVVYTIGAYRQQYNVASWDVEYVYSSIKHWATVLVFVSVWSRC